MLRRAWVVDLLEVFVRGNQPPAGFRFAKNVNPRKSKPLPRPRPPGSDGGVNRISLVFSGWSVRPKRENRFESVS